MSKPKIVFVVSNNPFSKDRNTILRLIKELLDLKAEVTVYLHGNGVWWLGLEDFEKLIPKGLKVFYGASSVKKRNQDIPPWAQRGDIDFLAELILSADKVLFFN
jgi:uncharacterized membrane protein YfbV (UPF0208 family)